MNASVVTAAVFVATLIGCVGDGADPSRAPNHPANAQAPETAYSAAPNALMAPSAPASSVTGAAPCASKSCPAGQRCMVMGTPPAPMCM